MSFKKFAVILLCINVTMVSFLGFQNNGPNEGHYSAVIFTVNVLVQFMANSTCTINEPNGKL